MEKGVRVGSVPIMVRSNRATNPSSHRWRQAPAIGSSDEDRKLWGGCSSSVVRSSRPRWLLHHQRNGRVLISMEDLALTVSPLRSTSATPSERRSPSLLPEGWDSQALDRREATRWHVDGQDQRRWYHADSSRSPDAGAWDRDRWEVLGHPRSPGDVQVHRRQHQSSQGTCPKENPRGTSHGPKLTRTGYYEVENLDEAHAWLEKKLAGQQKEYRELRISQMLDRELLPHLGDDEADRKKRPSSSGASFVKF